METKIKRLSKNQNTIVNDIISEFIAINDSEKTTNLSVIDSIFAEANLEITNKNAFYDAIATNNKNVANLGKTLGVALKNKLIDLFKGYPNVEVYSDTNGSCRIGFNNGNCNGLFWVSVHTLLTRNMETHKLGFAYKNNPDLPSVSKYSECALFISSVRVELSDFESSDVFKKALFNLLTKNPNYC